MRGCRNVGFQRVVGETQTRKNPRFPRTRVCRKRCCGTRKQTRSMCHERAVVVANISPVIFWDDDDDLCCVWKFSVSTAERKEVSSMEVSTPFLSGRTIGCMETNVVAPMSRLQWYIEDSGVTRGKLGMFT
uniref:GSVIVT01012776001, DGK n=1 Tax=Arundo donax TaxID=35708 RepID=A0A0A9DIK4_ARUDO